MKTSQSSLAPASSSSAWDRLVSLRDQSLSDPEPSPDLGAREELFRRTAMEACSEMMAAELAKLDVDQPWVMLGKQKYWRSLQSDHQLMTSCGLVTVRRTLYSTRKKGQRAICPLEMRAGIVAGFFTPLAARQAVWAVAHLTPRESAKQFAMLGGMAPSRSSLDRLPKKLSKRYELQREAIEETLRTQRPVPAEARSVQASLDGVLLLLRKNMRAQRRQQTASEGRPTKGPAGFKEAGVGTVSLYDRSGDVLETIRLARMPEKSKATLKQLLLGEVDAILQQRPDLNLIKLSDGFPNHWSFLEGELMPGHGYEAEDYFHAVENLSDTLASVYGDSTRQHRERLEKLKTVLKEEEDGVEQVIRSLAYLRRQHPRKARLAQGLEYFRQRRHRMRYAALTKAGLPIASGIAESACSTVVEERMKRSGMRWGYEGGQAIMTFRAAAQSERFDPLLDQLFDNDKHDIGSNGLLTPRRAVDPTPIMSG